MSDLSHRTDQDREASPGPIAIAAKLEHEAEVAVRNQLARHPRWRVALSVVGWLLVAAYFAFAATLIGLRYWVLPEIDRYAPVIERAVADAIGEKVTIGSVTAGWEGLLPQLGLADVRVYDRSGREALSLPAIEAVVSWSSVLYGAVRFHSLVLEKPALALRRNSAGELFVAGMRVGQQDSGPGLSRWLLVQSEILIRDAQITWEDEMRRAPPLRLAGVNVVLRNSGSSHRFAVNAVPAREFASTLDVRGELSAGADSPADKWAGRLYASLEYADLAAWQRWFDYPVEVQSGRGGIRLWMSLKDREVREVTADVALSGVVTRLARNLPQLSLDYLQGRLGYKVSAPQSDGIAATGREVFGHGLALRTTGGVGLPPSDFSLQTMTTDTGRQRGELSAAALSLEPLAHLGEFLPLPDAVRKHLVQSEPKGHVTDLRLDWQAGPDAVEHFKLRGKFAGLALRTNGNVPGFNGLTGSLEASESGGSFTLASENAWLDLPGFFPEARVNFDHLSGQFSWLRDKGRTEIRMANGAAANADAAGTFSGSYTMQTGSTGLIDLNVNLVRADARAAWRYIPHLPDKISEYLRTSILAGESRDVRLRLKGDLGKFPFESPKQGIFQVMAKVTGGEFQYVDGWPKVTGIAANLAFDGRGMQISAQRAGILGARVLNATVSIPDLFHGNEQLAVEGSAEGPASEFLRFIDLSPVSRFIDGATREMRATGSGRLQMKMDLPLSRPEAVKLSGSYFLQNSQVVFDPDLPQASQVSGRLDFTETGINLRGVNAQFLGGPMTVSSQPTSDNSLSFNAQGTATIAAIRSVVDVPYLDRASGAAAWRGVVTLRKRTMELAIDSMLQGVSIEAPAPLGKAAPEPVPFRLERTNAMESELAKRLPGLRLQQGGDVIRLTLGKSAGMVLVRRHDSKSYVVERAMLALNEAPVLPDRAGITVNGSLPYIDVDKWHAFVEEGQKAGTASPVPASMPVAVNLRSPVMDISGKRLNEVSVRVSSAGAQWIANLASRELSGDIQWRPEGRGRIVARLKRLAIPEDRPAQGAPKVETIRREMPALDVTAEQFIFKDHLLGQLELHAVNDTRDWRIERVQLITPEAVFSGNGVWQSWAARPSLILNMQLDVSDIGGFLDRFGYPKLMQGGSSKLQGKIGWAGTPMAIDFGTLTGNVTLSAEKGQFLKADPGIAKLLGVLSLQSLVTLDLRDLFREGFSYDTIGGTAEIAKGILNTENFAMRGPSAAVSMSGTIDLARETQDLKMRVVPSLGDGASTIAGVLMANPVFGITATILQRLFRNPLGQIFAVEYKVSGSWSEPKVDRLRVDAPAASAGPSQ